MARQLKKQPKGIDVLKIYINEATFTNMIREGLLSRDQYELIGSDPNGEEFPDDPRWVLLKSASSKAYEIFKRYCYEKRHEKG